jgi:hypothetical protein
LEKAIRDRATPSELDSAKHQLAGVLDPLVAELRALLGVQPPPPVPAATAPGGTPTESRAAAARLAGLLAESDPGAADFVEANQAALRPLFGDDAWSMFASLVQDYAFGDAQAQLEQALSRFDRQQELPS